MSTFRERTIKEQEQKEAETAEFLRYIPLGIAFLVNYLFYSGEEFWLNSIPIIILSVSIEFCFLSLNSKSILQSFIAWILWGPFFYIWYIDREGGILMAALPSIVLTWLFVRPAISWYLMKKVKEERAK